MLAQSPEQLTDEDQRRLVLRAAREEAPALLRSLRERPPTLGDLGDRLRSQMLTLAGSFLGLVLCPLIPVFVWMDVLPKIRALRHVRRAVRLNWRSWLREEDPVVAYWLLEGDVRRLISALPRRRRRLARDIVAEVDRIAQHWAEFHRKLELLDRALETGTEAQLEARRARLEARRELESDAVSRESQRRQLEALSAQIETRAHLAAWRGRLQNAEAECVESLSQLRAQITLMATVGEAPDQALTLEVTDRLRDLNRNLTATQLAAEEVLQLRV